MMITVTDLFDGVTPETSPITITVVEGSATTGGGGGAVDSVNGQTGVVVLDATDVGADASGAAVTAQAAAIAAAATDATTKANAAQTASQPLDGDLTTIAALDSATAGALVTDGAGWIRKTYAQLKTALSLVKADVGLGSVDNTADTAKPVSTAQQTALDLKANLASPALTGNPTAPTPSVADNDTSIATTAFVTAADTAASALLVPKSLYDANSLLYATTDDTPVALTVAASRIVGRKASGDIGALTPAEALAVLSGGGTPNGTKFLRDDNTLAVPAGGSFRGCRVYAAATQALTTGTETSILFSDDEYDTDAFHDTGSNTSRITIPTGLGGYYRFHFQAYWNGTPTAPVYWTFRKNGSTELRGRCRTDGTALSWMSTTATVLLSAADYVEVRVLHVSGANRSVGDASPYEPVLEVQYLGT